MKAIVIVFMQARNGAAAQEQSFAVRSDPFPPSAAVSSGAPSNFPQLPDRKAAPAPFWTWFIENPRSCRS